MADKKKNTTKRTELTTQVLERAVKKGTRHIADEAKELVGYTVKEKDGWVVKEYKDGKITRISKVSRTKSSKLILD